MNQVNRSDPDVKNGFPEWPTRQVVFATLLIVAITTSFYFLFRFSQLVFILFLAIVFSTAIRPAVEWLNRRGLSRPLGVILIYLIILLVIGGVIAAIMPLLVEQVGAISEVAPSYYTDLRSSLFLSQNLILQRIALYMPEKISIMPDESEETATAEEPPPDPAQPPTPAAPATPYPRLIGQSALALVATFVLGFYWTLERDRTVRSALLWISSQRREEVREIIVEMENKVGQFVIGQGILIIAVGSMALIAYLLIGVPYALVLGIVAGITEAIPVFGPILGAAPALIIALATDPSKAIWVAVAALIIQTAENYILVPKVMNRSVGVNSLVLLLAFVGFSLLFGLGGAIVSVPLAAIIQLLVDRFLLMPSLTDTQQTDLGRDQISLYRMEAQTLAKDFRKQLVSEEESDPEADKAIDDLEAIAAELDSILVHFEQKESPA